MDESLESDLDKEIAEVQLKLDIEINRLRRLKEEWREKDLEMEEEDSEEEAVIPKQVNLAVALNELKTPGEVDQMKTTDQETTDNPAASPVKTFKCQHAGCHKQFATKASLNRHTNVHTSKYQCQECQKRFAQRDDYQRHIRIHSDDKPFACDWVGCGKRFAQNGNLKQHMLKHNGDKMFRCGEDGCGKMFKTKDNLRVHLKYHSEVDPFKCDMKWCEKSFKTRYALTRHRKTHI